MTGDDRIQVDWPKAEELLKDFAIGSALSAASNLATGQFATQPEQNAPTQQAAQDDAFARMVAEEVNARQAAQEAAQQASTPTDAGISPDAENAPSGVFNTAQDAQETKPTQTVADIYANRATKRADTVIDTSQEGHTPAQQKVISDYESATDEGIVKFVDRVRSLQNQDYRNKISHKISEVSSRQIDDVMRLTGVDANGYSNIITGDAVGHIEKRHGENGEADQSMTDNDIARVGFVLENYDNVDLARNEEGTPRTSWRWRNSDGSPALQVVFTKKIDGTIYVVEAVPDSKRKALAIVSAYINKNDGSTSGQVLNMTQNAPQATSETPVDAIAPIGDNIAQENASVKPDGRDMDEGSVSPEDSTGAAPAGFDPVSQWQMEADAYHPVNEAAAQTTMEERGRAPMDIPTTDRNGRQVSKLVS